VLGMDKGISINDFKAILGDALLRDQDLFLSVMHKKKIVVIVYKCLDCNKILIAKQDVSEHSNQKHKLEEIDKICFNEN
jgi:hypothetical protein